MKVQSAGILVYRRSGDIVEVLLVHPGSPFWARKDSWSVPKGELDDGEDLQTTAYREFEEEVGVEAPRGTLLELGSARQASGKVNHVWAVEGSPDLTNFSSNTFEMEWPPKSGRMQEFPENDKAAWFELNKAATKIFGYQKVFLERLAEKLSVPLE